MSDPTSTFRFDGKVAVVVGAGPGLGATLGRRFARAGADVALVARSERSLRASAEAVREEGSDPVTVAADVTDVDATERMAASVLDRFGRVDVVADVAFGVAPRRNVLDMDRDDLERWRQVVEVGAFGTLLTSRFLAPPMVEQGHGAIVNLTSMSSRIGFAGRSEYAAGKAAAHRITHALADELGPFGVRVNCVAPGHIASEQLEAYYRTKAAEEATTYEAVVSEYTREMALGRIVTADEVANAVLFLASDLASGITGAILDVNAGHLFAP